MDSQGEKDMDKEEKELRDRYFEGPAQDIMSLQQFFIREGRPDLAEPEKEVKSIKLKGGGLARRKRSIARGCGAVMANRRKKTQYI